MFTNSTSTTLGIAAPTTPIEFGLTQFRAVIVSFTCATVNKQVRQAESLDLVEDRLKKVEIPFMFKLSHCSPQTYTAKAGTLLFKFNRAGGWR
jgi:hypothetical protein